jgi:endonuclease YncB( thermonuclease family)
VAAVAADESVTPEIHHVVDGDTFVVTVEEWPPLFGREIPVRVTGIDTPELRGRCQKEIDLANRAKGYTTNFLKGSEITLSNLGRDKYFRILADVTVDGKDLAEWLLRNHLAVPYSGGEKQSWCD